MFYNTGIATDVWVLTNRKLARRTGSAEMDYEPDTDLRDTEQMALQENGGIEAFLRRKVLPYAAVAWYREDIG